MIRIPQSATADTRTCDYTKVSRDTLLASSIQHVGDVHQALAFFAGELLRAAGRHDYDKLSDIDGFHRDFQTGFKQTEWWDRHRQLNRHHLNMADGVREDVNLIDVLDFIADCVMAGMARSGSVYLVQALLVAAPCACRRPPSSACVGCSTHHLRFEQFDRVLERAFQ